MFQRRSAFIVFLLIISTVASGCNTQPEVFPTITPAASETAHPTKTAAPSPTLQQPTAAQQPAAPTAVVEIIPTASPTPMVYAVVEGDNLTNIAFSFGLTLDELLAANPAVDPQFLSIGTELVIPIMNEEGEISLTEPTVETELILSNLLCSDQADTSTLCFFEVLNPTAEFYENVQVQLHLMNAEGAAAAAKEVFLPLNILLPAGKLPGWARFDNMAGLWETVEGFVISALPAVYPDDSRYIQVDLNADSQSGSGTLTFTTKGTLRLNGEVPAKIIWLLGAAYDADGNLLAVRRWEWADVSSGIPLSFSASLYSTNSTIEAVEFWTEARP